MIVKKIIHIADVHVRNFKRHKEYLNVFIELFNKIKDIKDESTIIYLAGDIVHSKTEMTPELIHVVSYFLKSCADICPTILILGNHDANLKNEGRLDALSPIVKNLHHPNLYYWKDSGVYEFENIHFSVFSVLGTPNNWVLAKDIKDDKIKIALHHGSVYGAKTDLDHVINNEYVKVDLFSGFDYVLLGDIHKRQYLNEEKTIHYPGSLIQQDHAETLDRGFTVWNLEDKTSEFIPVENEIGYVTLNCKHDSLMTDISYIQKWPPRLRLRIKHEMCSKEYIQSLIAKLKTKFQLEEVSTPKVNSNSYLTSGASSLEDIRDIEYQGTLITEYAKAKKIENIDLDYIRHINRLVNSELNSNTKLIRNIKWRPKLLEFSNMFSYGENNIINFDNIFGIYGIFAPNASGKSSLLDIFTYCIYDKCSRAWKAKDVLNNQKTKFKCKLSLELAGELYVIERVGFSTKSNSVRVEVDFYKIDLSGNKILLNGIDRDETNKAIRDHLGTYDDFLLTTLSTQNDNKNFIFKKQSERKELVYSFLDLCVFDDLHNIAKKYIKEKSSELYLAEIELKSDEYVQLDKNLEQIEKSISKYNNSIQTLSSSRDKIQDEINQLNKQIDPLYDSYTVFSGADETELKNLQTQRIQREKTLEQINSDLLVTNSKMEELQIKIGDERFTDLDIRIEKYSTVEQDHYKLVIESGSLSSQINNLQFKIHQLELHEYDPNCEYCIKNQFVQDAQYALKDLPQVQTKIGLVLDELHQSKILKSELESLLNLKEQRSILNNEIIDITKKSLYLDSLKNEINSNIINIDRKISLLEDKRNKFIQFEERVTNNLKLKKEISSLEKSLIDITKQLSDQQNRLSDVIAKKIYADKKRESKIKLISTINSLKHEVESYNMYITMTHNDGIPYMILQKILPVIENEVNLILSGVVEFYIKFECDEKSNINCYLYYSDDKSWPVEMASGMERFITSLAVRCALIEVTSLPRPVFVAIDEGFGALDSEKVGSLPLLFDYMRSKFDFIIAVSHIDTMRDMVDGLIDIHKNSSGFSEVHVV